ncbi:nucleotidyltransferase domain-containing protein, partial [Candidatus Woesearchaeota archaeon]|nr:nucleotidyltransferase domain-containing protein [Candidatus Woesearchaeota archaeon]
KILFEENVVDYREEGKNKVYFLKKNSESRSYIFMAEHYKLIRMLEIYPYLRKAVEKIQLDKRISLAVIFGSYAKNTANKNSDVDVYIETRDKKIKQDLEGTDSKLSIKIGAYDRKNLLIKEIEKNHVIIKGVEGFYEKNELFG